MEYTDLYDVKSSEMAYELDVLVEGFGLAPIKPEGAALEYDSEIQGGVARYTHLAYALGYVVTYEELRDDLYEQVSMRRVRTNAFSMAQTIEQVAVFPYNNAFNATTYPIWDTASMCSTAHPLPTGGTLSNALSPPADLTEASLEDLTIQMMGIQTDRQLYASVLPRSLIVPRQEWYNANRILKSVLQSGTSNNDINVLKATNAFPEGIKLNHYLTSPHAWFIRSNIPGPGLQFFWREKPSFDRDNDFNTKNALAASYMRLSCGISEWRAIFGSNGP
jgi:hypothetical protein